MWHDRLAHEIIPAGQSGTVAMDVDDRIEQFGLWSVFHKHLIVEWFALLRDELGGDYWVDMESEVLLVPRPPGPARAVAPDVDVTRPVPPGPAPVEHSAITCVGRQEDAD